jgi:hypothetical protein
MPADPATLPLVVRTGDRRAGPQSSDDASRQAPSFADGTGIRSPTHGDEGPIAPRSGPQGKP